MSTSRRGGFEITSPQVASPRGPTSGDTPQEPGAILFELVFSNESLWSTVDPHAAQAIVEHAVRTKGVVDLGDLLTEVIARKTDPGLARGVVLTFAMELARAGIAVRLPPELQALDRTARQALVDKFRKGQKRDEPTQTMAQRSSGPSTRSPAAPRGSSGAQPAANADGWAAGLAELSDPRARKAAATSLKEDVSGKHAAATKRTEEKAAREKTKTSVNRPRPSAGDFGVEAFGPGRIAMVATSVIFLLTSFIVSPRTSSVTQGANTFPRDVPCATVEKNGAHFFCIVDATGVSPTWTASDLYERKARMLTAAKAAGAVSLTFYNADFSRWDPTPAPQEMEVTGSLPPPTAPTNRPDEQELYERPEVVPTSSGGDSSSGGEEPSDQMDDDEPPAAVDEVQLTTKPAKKKRKRR